MEKFKYIESEYSQNVSTYNFLNEDFDKNNLIKHFFEHCDSFNANDPKFPRMSMREYGRRALELMNSKVGLSTSDEPIIGFEIAPKQGEKNTKNRLVKIKKQWDFVDPNIKGTENVGEVVIYSKDGYIVSYYASKPNRIKTLLSQFVKELDENIIKEEVKENMKLNEQNNKEIKRIDWNGKTYVFTNTFKKTGAMSHDFLTMDDGEYEYQGEVTWINRPWHRFDLEEAWVSIVEEAFGSKAKELCLEINKKAKGIEDAIDKFFAKFDPKDINNERGSDNEAPKDKKVALAEYLEVSVDEIEDGDRENEFVCNGEVFEVLNDDEANERFRESCKLYLEDSFEVLPEYLQESIIQNCVSQGDIDVEVDYIIRDDVDMMWEDDIAEDCIDEGIVEREEVFDDEGNLRDDIDFDELKDKLSQAKLDSMGDDERVERVLEQHPCDDYEYWSSFINIDDATQEIMDDIEANSSRGQELSTYDGQEVDLGNGLFAYRQ